MNYATKESLIAFESRIKSLWEDGQLRMLLHLCGGNEGQLLDIFCDINEGDWIFSTHRSHYHALLAGIPEAELEAMIVRGDSMFVFSQERRFYTSSVLAGTCGIAVGVAHAILERGGAENVYCFVGDGAEDEGHFYEAVCYAAGHNLPLFFIIEDNDRSVDTTVAGRRGAGCGGAGCGGTGWRMQWPQQNVLRYRYQPTYPHAGSGCAQQIQFRQ